MRTSGKKHQYSRTLQKNKKLFAFAGLILTFFCVPNFTIGQTIITQDPLQQPSPERNFNVPSVAQPDLYEPQPEIQVGGNNMATDQDGSQKKMLSHKSKKGLRDSHDLSGQELFAKLLEEKQPNHPIYDPVVFNTKDAERYHDPTYNPLVDNEKNYVVTDGHIGLYAVLILMVQCLFTVILVKILK